MLSGRGVVGRSCDRILDALESASWVTRALRPPGRPSRPLAFFMQPGGLVGVSARDDGQNVDNVNRVHTGGHNIITEGNVHHDTRLCLDDHGHVHSAW